MSWHLVWLIPKGLSPSGRHVSTLWVDRQLCDKHLSTLHICHARSHRKICCFAFQTTRFTPGCRCQSILGGPWLWSESASNVGKKRLRQWRMGLMIEHLLFWCRVSFLRNWSARVFILNSYHCGCYLRTLFQPVLAHIWACIEEPLIAHILLAFCFHLVYSQTTRQWWWLQFLAFEFSFLCMRWYQTGIEP